MTRFARAKGSKASNEKLPEEATSWSEMKQELLNKNKELAEQKNREAAVQRRADNYKAFLDDVEEEENKKIEWADFPVTAASAKPSSKRKFTADNKGFANGKPAAKKVKQQLSRESEEPDDSEDDEFSALKSQIDKALLMHSKTDSGDHSEPPEEAGIRNKPEEILVKKQKIKKPKHKLNIVVEKDSQAAAESETSQSSKKEQTKDERLISKKRDRRMKQVEKQKLKRPQLRNGNPNPDETSQSSQTENGVLDETKAAKKLERRKKQKEKKKRNLARNLNSTEEVAAEKPPTEQDLKNIEKKKQRRARQIEKRQKFKEQKALAHQSGNSEQQNNAQSENQTSPNDETNSSSANNTVKNEDPKSAKKAKLNKKPAKPRDKKIHPSRKQKSETLFLNGRTIEVDYVDGFPVKKEDAQRLETLRKEMISKGLPRSEIDIALKLERRRAERSFARAKKSVCFKCRQSGHLLSECPELDKGEMADTSGTGICFKCGSTEHTHYECKVVRGMEFKFASCFICKEQGHIAKQCPDNQRGLYPNGGACKVCGDVTHLKKDCPKYQAQQTQLQNSLSLGTWDNDNPDAMDVLQENI
ncbi:hypothetical protein HUJ04_007613 [Dendroctonus ponderosae]|uniref:CCHC-type domain-containing protein n=2 Tax=Dendroctonus ponderosae TaxID=77166 RepID=A0AAR5QAH5_DENPD|nr:hypothetical protein HUJ04_007613 [Dendroctonus ponderosae]